MSLTLDDLKKLREEGMKIAGELTGNPNFLDNILKIPLRRRMLYALGTLQRMPKYKKGVDMFLLRNVCIYLQENYRVDFGYTDAKWLSDEEAIKEYRREYDRIKRGITI